MGCLAVIGGLVVFVCLAALIGPIPALLLCIGIGILLLLVKKR